LLKLCVFPNEPCKSGSKVAEPLPEQRKHLSESLGDIQRSCWRLSHKATDGIYIFLADIADLGIKLFVF
jgi:hypothetical protein